jgi:hypothetical protein
LGDEGSELTGDRCTEGADTAMIEGKENDAVGDVDSDTGAPTPDVAGAFGAGRMLESEACFFLSGFLRLLETDDEDEDEEEGGGTATGPVLAPSEATAGRAWKVWNEPERERGDAEPELFVGGVRCPSRSTVGTSPDEAVGDVENDPK